MGASGNYANKDDSPPPHRAGRALAVAGALLQLGLLFAIVSYFSVTPVTYPEKEILPSLEGVGLMISGFMAASIGAILLLLALLGTRYRAPWFFWFLMVYGAALTALLFIVPLVSILTVAIIPLGPACLLYCFVRKRDFFPRRRFGFTG